MVRMYFRFKVVKLLFTLKIFLLKFVLKFRIQDDKEIMWNLAPIIALTNPND